MIEPVKLRKTITTVDAVPLAVDNLEQVREWIASKGGTCALWSEPPMRAITGLALVHPDGTMSAIRFGDWVAYDGVVLYAIPASILDSHFAAVDDEAPPADTTALEASLGRLAARLDAVEQLAAERGARLEELADLRDPGRGRAGGSVR